MLKTKIYIKCIYLLNFSYLSNTSNKYLNLSPYNKQVFEKINDFDNLCEAEKSLLINSMHTKSNFNNNYTFF